MLLGLRRPRKPTLKDRVIGRTGLGRVVRATAALGVGALGVGGGVALAANKFKLPQLPTPNSVPRQSNSVPRQSNSVPRQSNSVPNNTTLPSIKKTANSLRIQTRLAQLKDGNTDLGKKFAHQQRQSNTLKSIKNMAGRTDAEKSVLKGKSQKLMQKLKSRNTDLQTHVKGLRSKGLYRRLNNLTTFKKYNFI